MTSLTGRPKLVLLGILTKIPVGGVIWQVAQYLLGFQRLGYDVHYVESHAGTPSALMMSEEDDSSARAATFLGTQMNRLGLGDKWAFHALHHDGACYGMSLTQLRRLYREAALIINLHGATEPLPEHAATGRLVYLETDPVQLQVELHDGEQATLDFLEPHVAFFTSALNYGNPSCRLPWSDRFPAVPSPPPVVLEAWPADPAPGRAWTTIGNWRQDWRPVRFLGETYRWSKHYEFLKVLDLPERSRHCFELALASYEESDAEHLRSRGWEVIPGYPMSTDPDVYRDYVRRSRGEFSVAKDQNVRLRTGWFSERSATYLASGRPVVVQDTAFAEALPTGEGLLAFSNLEEAAAAVETVEGNYQRHRRAASDIARGYLDSDVVLGSFLDHLGAERSGRAGTLRASDPSRQHPLPEHLVLTPTSRRPLRLPAATVEAVRSRPVPSAARGSDVPGISVVMATYDNLVVTRLALESVLLNSRPGSFEVVVVDNGSAAEAREYLQVLAARNRHVRLVLNEENRGFAAATNQGIERARGEVVVLLNNDTIVPPGALEALAAHTAEPDVGLVGPVTNRCGNEAEIGLSYDTYGELLAAVAHRPTSSVVTDIPVAVMFCAAARRSVLAAVGPLDEGFGVGMFEDDDYAMRVRAAGLRVVLADDVFVHHFGEATLGLLAAEGKYGEVFHRNRRRFEDKWRRPWQPHARRPDGAYELTRSRVLEAVVSCTPPGAVVAVASKGDDAAVDLPERCGWHFPGAADGTYAGQYPGTAAEAIALVEGLVDAGATHLVFPSWSWWWLNHYEGLADHLERRYRRVLDEADACVAWALGPQGGKR